MADAIGRIGSTGPINRDSRSTGHDAVDKALTQDQKQNQAQNISAPAKPPRNKAVEDVAKLYEKEFLREMHKAMKDTIHHTEEPSMAENIYQGQLDDQYVDQWGENGGVGLSNMIYEQIMQRYFPENDHQLKQQGPIAISNRDVTSITQVKTAEAQAGQVPLKVQLAPSVNGASAQIKAPWSGDVITQTRLGDRSAVTLQHGLGLRSTLIFDGVPGSGVEVGQRLEKNATVGILSPEANSFFWNLKRDNGGATGSGGIANY